MSRGGADPLNPIIALFAGNLLYLVVTLVLAYLLGLQTIDIFTGAFSNTASGLVVVWVSVGGLLGIVDVLAVLAFIFNVAGGEW